MEMEIKLFKLKSGEEVIARIDDTGNDEGNIVLENPVALVMHPQNGMVMVSWLPYSDDTQHTISQDDVMVIANVKSELVDVYKQQFGQIVVPQQDKKLII